MADDTAWIRLEGAGATDPDGKAGLPPSIALGGGWRIDNLAGLLADTEQTLRRLDRTGTGGRKRTGNGAAETNIEIDASKIDYLDSGGAWLLFHLKKRLTDQGAQVTLSGLGADDQPLFDRVSTSAARIDITDVPEPRNPLIDTLAGIGGLVVGAGQRALELLSFFGLTVILLFRTLLQPWRLELTATVKYIQRTGLDALLIVGLLTFLIGVVLAYMGAVQLKAFGAEIFTVNLVGVAVLRELGVLITSILIAGRSGSSFTAQIGTMKVNQEVDAMQTIGLNPIEILVLPRLIALMISLPLLTFYADMMGLAGGAVMSVLVLDITVNQFLDQLSGAIDLNTFLVGMSKAPVFAYLIALVGCYEGLKVTGSAESVGQRTTMAVVEAIFLVILVDAIFAIAYSYIGI